MELFASFFSFKVPSQSGGCSTVPPPLSNGKLDIADGKNSDLKDIDAIQNETKKGEFW